MEERLYISKCRKDAVFPKYANPGDAGMDLYSTEDVLLAPGETKLIHTGLKFAIPVGYEVQIRPRSGLSLNTPLRIPNAPGTIDSGYRGEICIILENTSSEKYADAQVLFATDKGNKKGPYQIKKGDRIAQMVFAKYETADLVMTESVDTIGIDRKGGFGSTGV